MLNKYRRYFNARGERLDSKPSIPKIIGGFLYLLCFIALLLWLVDIVKANDIATIKHYEQECGQDVLCLRNVYYKYNVLK